MHQHDLELIIFWCRLSGDDSSLNGSYRQNSEFFKRDEAAESSGKHSDDRSDNANVGASNQNQSLTWDTLKKIRRQKSRRNTSDLKKYQSTVCLYPPQNTFLSLQPEPEQNQRSSSGLGRNLKYEEVYRSSPSLRSINSFVCHESRVGRHRNNFTFSKQLSASALKFTGWCFA